MMPVDRPMLIRKLKIHSCVIEAEIVSGCSIGKVVYIPCINSYPTETPLPFKFRRMQFPLRPAFAMTINKLVLRHRTRPCAWLAFICPVIPFS